MAYSHATEVRDFKRKAVDCPELGTAITNFRKEPSLPLPSSADGMKQKPSPARPSRKRCTGVGALSPDTWQKATTAGTGAHPQAAGHVRFTKP